jgi:hypothetical protein
MNMARKKMGPPYYNPVLWNFAHNVFCAQFSDLETYITDESLIEGTRKEYHRLKRKFERAYPNVGLRFSTTKPNVPHYKAALYKSGDEVLLEYSVGQ